MLKVNKKQVKIVSVVIAAVFVLGIAAIGVSQFGVGKTYAASSSSSIGVVNYQQLVNQHPDMPAAQAAFKAAVDQAQKDFQAKSATMTTDAEKQAYHDQLQQGLAQKQQDLLQAIQDKVNTTVQQVAAAKGLSVVLDKNAVVYGGQDITDDCSKKITGK